MSASTTYIANSVGSIFNDSMGGTGEAGGEDDWTTPTLRAHIGLRSVILPAYGAIKASWLQDLLSCKEEEDDQEEDEEEEHVGDSGYDSESPRGGLHVSGEGDGDADEQLRGNKEEVERTKATATNLEVRQAAEEVVKHQDWLGMVVEDFKGRWRFWGFERGNALDH